VARPTHLLQLVHEVCCVEFDLVIGIVQTPFNNLVYNMEIAYVIVVQISSNVQLCSARGLATHTSRQPQV
jgi:hypothetical protein